jgi:hypothetical protein
VRYLGTGAASVPGWLAAADGRAFTLVDRVQRDGGVGGDLLEIGVFKGKSAILLEFLRAEDERLVLCDLFGRPPDGDPDAAVYDVWYDRFGRRDFEQNWLRFHSALPVIHEMTSTALGEVEVDRSFRVIHLDGSHAYDNVMADLDLASRLLVAGGVVVVDDWRTDHSPGVGAATWLATERFGLRPVFVTSAKLYGVVGDDAVTDEVASGLQGAVRAAFRATDSHLIRGRDVVRVVERAASAPGGRVLARDAAASVARRVLRRRASQARSSS